jgi:Fe-S cluster assembly scaffold protein SufB
VGSLNLDYELEALASASGEMTSRVYGSEDDEIDVREVLRLNGSGARGFTKTRIAVRQRARSRVVTIAEGNAPYTSGHMDCAEIVRDSAVAENMPHVVVRNDQSQITHEAAIGRVNKKELETLMARGLDEDAAVDVIVRGMLS